MFEETSSAAHALAQRTLSLGQAIDQFHIDNAAAPKRQNPPSRLEASLSRAPVEVALKSAAGSGAPAATVSDNEWSEF